MIGWLRQRLIQRQDGTAIVTAIGLMSAMLISGMAAYTVLDTQQTNSARDRQREGSFNYAEAVLNTQAFILSRQWPGNATVNYADCQQGATSGFCPQAAQLNASAKGADFDSGVEWQSSVRDDVSGSHYDTSAANAAHWDANGNKRVWIRAQAKVRGRIRTLLELVQVQEFKEELPKRTIIAGRFTVHPTGKHVYIATHPDETSGHEVTVRCNPTLDPPEDCADYDRGKQQIDPDDAVTGPDYVDDEDKAVPVLERDVRDRLRERAMADGTYYAGCPNEAQLNGKVVWVENCSTSYKSNATFNSSASPGILIWNNGTVEFDGNSTFNGIVYHTNQSDLRANLVILRGGITINGGVYVDGKGGGVDVGSNKVNISFDINAFELISSYGAAGLVQNSWREIPASQY